MHKAQISKSVFNQFLTGGDRYASATKNMQIFIKMELSLSRKNRYSKNKSSKSFIFWNKSSHSIAIRPPVQT